ncbi:hypothetical protein HGG71_05840 [Rhodobacteraceae bacterium R_SAG2]|nr:hypothetical protein [Rhodobacteraceae bacterium R_SAG2]
MNAHAETLQRNLSALQRTTVKQKDEINRLWRKVESLTADKAALLADVKILRTEKHADAEAIASARNDALREAAQVAGEDFFDRAKTARAAEHAAEIEEAILALIEGDTNDPV